MHWHSGEPSELNLDALSEELGQKALVLTRTLIPELIYQRHEQYALNADRPCTVPAMDLGGMTFTSLECGWNMYCDFSKLQDRKLAQGKIGSLLRPSESDLLINGHPLSRTIRDRLKAIIEDPQQTFHLETSSILLQESLSAIQNGWNSAQATL